MTNGVNGKAQLEDITDVSGVSSRQKRKQQLLACAVVVTASACLWTAYQWYGKPWLSERRVDLALRALSTSSDVPPWKDAVVQIKAQPREQMLLSTFDTLAQPIAGLDEALRVEGARGALDLAIAEGSDEARLILGKALRDGIFGTKDSVSALREFDRVRFSTEPGVKAGDAVALYLHARMLSEGLGVTLDRGAAAEFVRRAADGLTGWRIKDLANEALHGYGVFKDGKAPEFASRMARHLVATGDQSAYRIGVSSCNELHDIDVKPTNNNFALLDEAVKRRNACREPWIKDAAVAGYKPAMADYADTLLSEQGSVELAIKWFEAAGAERSNIDNYYYGVLKAVSATDLDAVASGVKMMWTALKEEKKTQNPIIGASYGDVLHLNIRMQKALAKNAGYSRRNFALAVLAQGELEKSVPEAITAAQADVGMAYLVPLVRSSDIRRTASLVAQAVRTNQPFHEVANVQSTKKLLPFQGKLDTPSQPDPEQQAKTGYLAGAPKNASGGLSTFTVDNSTGGRDAMVRLYLGGKKPAVRSFYIKVGEKFTSKSLMPGNYVMRYRFMGSVDTFEADNSFLLMESETENGRRFSNVTVTLYKVRDGNMTTKRVAAEEF
jgi:TPR repeat protein